MSQMLCYGGRKLYAALARVQYPSIDRLSPDILDWIYEESDCVPFLEWLTNNLTLDSYVPSEDLQEYQSIPTEDLLSGDLLDAALEASGCLNDSDESLLFTSVQNLTEAELEDRIAQLETELATEEETLELLNNIKDRCLEQTARDRIAVGQLGRLSDAYNGEVNRCNEDLSQYQRQSYRSCLETADRVTESFVEALARSSGSADSCILASHVKLDQIQAKENQLKEELDEFIRAHFGTRFDGLDIHGRQGGDSNGIPNDPDRQDDSQAYDGGDGGPGLLNLEDNDCLELVKGRDRATFQHSIAEINRLRVSHYNGQLLLAETKAKDSGIVACINFIESKSSIPNQATVNTQTDSTTTPGIHVQLQEDDLREELSMLIKRITSQYCRKILNVDFLLKHKRSLYVLGKLDVIKDLLMNEKGRQELLHVLLRDETDFILGTKKLLVSLSEFLEEKIRKADNFSRGVKIVAQSGHEAEEKQIVPADDVTMCNLHKILQASGYVGQIATYSSMRDAISQVLLHTKTDFIASKRSLQLSRAANLYTIRSHVRKLFQLLKMTSSSNQIGEDDDANNSLRQRRCVRLRPREISLGMERLEAGLKQLELGLKKVMTDWDQEKEQLKRKPELRLARDLWVEFLLRPDAMTANVRALQRKIQD